MLSFPSSPGSLELPAALGFEPIARILEAEADLDGEPRPTELSLEDAFLGEEFAIV